MFHAVCKHLKPKTKTVIKLRYNFEGVNKFIKIQSLSILRTSYKTYQLSKDEQWGYCQGNATKRSSLTHNC